MITKLKLRAAILLFAVFLSWYSSWTLVLATEVITPDGIKEVCWSENIVPDVAIACALSGNKDAPYFYNGKKGEVVMITVSSNVFVPQLTVIDANGNSTFYPKSYEVTEQTNSLKVTIPLSYEGQYTFDVWARQNAREGDKFTIKLTSDKSRVTSDIRQDSLIEGETYTVKELNSNFTISSRKFKTNAYVVYVYKAPYCAPPQVQCKPSALPHIIISDRSGARTDYANMTTEEAALYTGNDEYRFEIGKKYAFNAEVENTSRTNVPKNKFTLISARNIDGSKLITLNQNINNNQPVKKFFIARFWQWFTRLFKK